jgi:hypothetical protein
LIRFPELLCSTAEFAFNRSMEPVPRTDFKKDAYRV